MDMPLPPPVVDPNAPPRFLNRETPPHLVTLVLLAALSALSMNVFLPSMPSMAKSFDVEPAVIQLTITIYLVANAIMQTIIGPVSDKVGRRPVLLWSTAIFILATAGTLVSPNITVFLIFRAIQAVIAAGLVLSRAVVRDLFGPEKAASMIGYITMGMAIAPMFGPTIGGILDGFFGWRGAFGLLLVAGIIQFLIIHADLGETRQRQEITLGAQFAQYPELFRSRRFWGYCMASALSSGAFFSYLGGAPFVGAEVYHLDPRGVGMFFGVVALGYGFGNFLSGRFSVRVGMNRMMLIGTFVAMAAHVALLLVVLAGWDTPYSFFGLMMVFGVGNGFVMPASTAGMLSVRPHLAGTASGLGGAIMLAGGAVFATLSGIVLRSGHGALPLVLLMLSASSSAVLAAFYVVRRARAVGE